MYLHVCVDIVGRLFCCFVNEKSAEILAGISAAVQLIYILQRQCCATGAIGLWGQLMNDYLLSQNSGPTYGKDIRQFKVKISRFILSVSKNKNKNCILLSFENLMHGALGETAPS